MKGKFEGQPAYVEYYWNIFLDGLADKDDGRLLGFQVTKQDKALFPALKRRKMVWLEETEDGFVVER